MGKRFMQQVLFYSPDEIILQQLENNTSDFSFSQAIQVLHIEDCFRELQNNINIEVLVFDCGTTAQIDFANLGKILAQHSQTRVIALTKKMPSAAVKALVSLGLSGAIARDDIEELLPVAIDVVGKGGLFIIGVNSKTETPPHFAAKNIFPHNSRFDNLSLRQKQITKFLIKGLTNKEIARELNIEVGTVKAHLNGIFRKLAIQNRNQIYNSIAMNSFE
jgi:DNA-binding NarL/FixJ family response regulator